MYYTPDPSDGSTVSVESFSEEFVLSAKLYENEGVYISINEKLPSDFTVLNNSSNIGLSISSPASVSASLSVSSTAGANSSDSNNTSIRFGDRKSSHTYDSDDDDEEENASSNFSPQKSSVSRVSSTNPHNGPLPSVPTSGYDLFNRTNSGLVAKLERQCDNSFLLCLNTCRYCDYEHGHYSCGMKSSSSGGNSSSDAQYALREVGARIKHVSSSVGMLCYHVYSCIVFV